MSNNQEGHSDDDIRQTQAYLQATHLLSEKRMLQARLREVDRILRELETLGAGVTGLARGDLDRKARMLPAR